LADDGTATHAERDVTPARRWLRDEAVAKPSASRVLLFPGRPEQTRAALLTSDTLLLYRRLTNPFPRDWGPENLARETSIREFADNSEARALILEPFPFPIFLATPRELGVFRRTPRRDVRRTTITA
jgi:hypothetical protein